MMGWQWHQLNHIQIIHTSPQTDNYTITLYVSFGQGSSLLWTHTLRPFYSRPIALNQEGRSQVDDVCECMRD